MLALNLMDEMVNGTKGLGEARDYYAQEFLDARRKQLTPYMEKLRFAPLAGSTADPDERALGRGARSGRPRWERGGGLILGAGPASRVYRHCGVFPEPFNVDQLLDAVATAVGVHCSAHRGSITPPTRLPEAIGRRIRRWRWISSTRLASDRAGSA